MIICDYLGWGRRPVQETRTHPIQDGYDIRTVQELLGHKDVKTTMIYTHVLNRDGRGVRSSVDFLRAEMASGSYAETI